MHQAYEESKAVNWILSNDSVRFCQNTQSDRNFLRLHILAASSRSKDLGRFYDVITEEYKQSCYNYAFKNVQTCTEEPYKAIQKLFTGAAKYFQYVKHGRGDLSKILSFLRKTKRSAKVCWWVCMKGFSWSEWFWFDFSSLKLAKRCLVSVVFDNCGLEFLEDSVLSKIAENVVRDARIPFEDFRCQKYEDNCGTVVISGSGKLAFGFLLCLCYFLVILWWLSMYLGLFSCSWTCWKK